MIGQIIEIVNTLIGFQYLGIGHKTQSRSGGRKKGHRQERPAAMEFWTAIPNEYELRRFVVQNMFGGPSRTGLLDAERKEWRFLSQALGA